MATNENRDDLIARFKVAAPSATAGAEQTGGGCVWFAVRWPDGRSLTGTVAFEDDGEWSTDAVLAKKREPWFVGFHLSDDDEPDFESYMVLSDDGFVAKAAEIEAIQSIIYRGA